MTTYCKPVDEAVDAIMNATRPMTKAEVEKLLGVLYNAAYDDGRAVGDQAGYMDGFEDGKSGDYDD